MHLVKVVLDNNPFIFWKEETLFLLCSKNNYYVERLGLFWLKDRTGLIKNMIKKEIELDVE